LPHLSIAIDPKGNVRQLPFLNQTLEVFDSCQRLTIPGGDDIARTQTRVKRRGTSLDTLDYDSIIVPIVERKPPRFQRILR
jgi:hypothetical protein